MTRTQHRINEREAELRRAQPLVQKMIARASCILAECDKLTDDERKIVADRLGLIAATLSKVNPIPNGH